MTRTPPKSHNDSPYDKHLLEETVTLADVIKASRRPETWESALKRAHDIGSEIFGDSAHGVWFGIYHQLVDASENKGQNPGDGADAGWLDCALRVESLAIANIVRSSTHFGTITTAMDRLYDIRNDVADLSEYGWWSHLYNELDAFVKHIREDIRIKNQELARNRIVPV